MTPNYIMTLKYIMTPNYTSYQGGVYTSYMPKFSQIKLTRFFPRGFVSISVN